VKPSDLVGFELGDGTVLELYAPGDAFHASFEAGSAVGFEVGNSMTRGKAMIFIRRTGSILQLGPRFDPDDRARVGEADFPGKAPVAVKPVDLPQHRDGAGFDAAVALVEIDTDFDLALFSDFEGGLDIGL
jgi:hypothetical protein